VALGSYGNLPLHQSQDETPKEPMKRLETIGADDVGKTVLFRARLANSRQQGNKMLFCELRQGLVSIQGLLELNETKEDRPLVDTVCMHAVSTVLTSLQITGIQANDEIQLIYNPGVNRIGGGRDQTGRDRDRSNHDQALRGSHWQGTHVSHDMHVPLIVLSSFGQSLLSILSQSRSVPPLTP